MYNRHNKLKHVGIQALILLLTLLPITVNSQQLAGVAHLTLSINY